jgi:hypothetical protein
MSKSIKDFTKGNISASEFTEVLRENEVEIDDKLSLMIKREAAGDSQSYIAFGAHIFRKLNGSETYNRVDKINFNNLKIMGVEKVKNPFGYADDLETKKRKTLDLDKI